MKDWIRWTAGVILALCALSAQATEFSSSDYDLYVGDFNGDGKSDLLYIGKTPDKPSGIAMADASGVPSMGAPGSQSWPSSFLNIPWSNGSYKAIIGDFNGDHCADILLQTQTPGSSYVLLTNCNPANGPVGQVVGISQAIPSTYMGLAWSADQHLLIAGDFDGDGKTDLLLQSTVAGGTNAVVLADTSGNLFTRSSSNCYAGGPQQCWTDGYQGFKWSTKSAMVYAGDFNGDGKSDLLVVSKPTFVMIDYDVPFPVPKFPSQGMGIFLAQTPDGSGAIIRTPNQLWSYTDLGANWSTLLTNIIVGDFNGDDKADVLIQGKNSSRPNLILYSNSSGTGLLQTATTPGGGVASWTADTYALLSGKFGGNTVTGLFLQATNAGGTNYYVTGNISTGSVTATASSMQMVATATSPANGVGATAGSADVSASGTGLYTIPLELPRGTAGMTPELSLQYAHSGANGLLGVGWGLSGLSVITRCPMTVAQDGVAQGVQYLVSDQYCLDGNRLRLTSGTQGADSSQYRTELETYSLIIAHGAGTNGPVWFEVRRKDGQIYEYGNTADSRVAGTGGTRAWAVNKIRDRAGGLTDGNAIAFGYINGSLNSLCPETSADLNNYRLCQITYAGNATQGTSPPYTIQFSYQGRNTGEVLSRYYLGQQITEVNRLAKIQVSNAATVVRSWTLGYDSTATPTHASRVSSIQECGENNTCFGVSTFTWSTQAFTGNTPTVTDVPTPTSAGLNYFPATYPDPCIKAFSVDIDGDGVPDQLVWDCTNTPNSLTLQWGTPKGQTPRSPASIDLSSNLGATGYGTMGGGGASDVDMDGKEDFVFGGQCPTGVTAGCYAHFPTASTSVPTITPLPSGGVPGVIGTIDMDGDGFPDQILYGANDFTHIYIGLHNHGGTQGYQAQQLAWTAPAGVTLASLPSWNPTNIGNVIEAADFDADGRQDMLVQTTSGWRVLYSNGIGFTTGDLIVPEALFNAPQAYNAPVLVDINGDGCTDLAYPSSATNGAGNHTWIIQLSKCGVYGGSGFTAPIDTGYAAPPTTNGPSPISAVDINGDGYQDLVYNTGTGLVVMFSTGTGLSAPVPLITTAEWIDMDGDGLPDALSGGTSYFSAVGPKSDLMLSAADAFGNSVSYTYAPLTDPTVYTRGQGQAGVTQDMSGPMYVVKQTQSTDGVGGHYTMTYAYQGAHRNVQGRGFLGFHGRTITDSRTGIVTQETYNNIVNADGSQWDFTGTLAHSTTYQWAGGPVLTDVANSWVDIHPDSATNRFYPYIQTKTETRYELNNTGTPITTAVTSTTIDNYGTPINVSMTTTENSTGIYAGSSRTQQVAIPSVVNDTTDWCLSKPATIQSTNSHTLSNGAAITHTTAESWDGPHCRLTDKNLEVGSSWELDTHYDYDSWNNIADQVVHGTSLPSRTTLFDYHTGAAVPGQFLMKATNALSQTTTFTWETARAVKLTASDPNGLLTTWGYDDFGRLVHEVRPDGTGSRRTYFPCSATGSCGDSLLRYMVQEDERDTTDALRNYQYLFYDSLGRIKYDETTGFDGTLSVVESLYDPRGNLASGSMPYYAGAGRYTGTSYTYDLYSRITQTQRPTSDTDPTPATNQIVYNGLTVSHVDALGNSRTEVSDGWGDIIRVIDEAANNSNYTFDAFSNLKTSTDAGGNVTTLTYNVRGFKMTSSDPDLGNWSYTYDGLGELLTQIDAKAQTTAFQYDLLGRMQYRTDPGAVSPDSTWTWDTAAHGIGQLGSVTGPSSYSETYTYDTAGRKSSETIVAAAATYAVNYGYDPVLGKLQTITYPTSTSTRFEVFYDYNQYGYMTDAVDYTGQTRGTMLWQASLQDARGHVTQEKLGNGQWTNVGFDQTNGQINSVQTGSGGGTSTQNFVYSWDRNGNLTSRRDANQNLTETFGYDSMSRLTSVSLNGATPSTVSYDAINNVNVKSDISPTAYNYNTAQTGCSYAGLPTQPHAVRNAGGTVYCYDADGNMTSRGGATVSWYGYNLPQTINQAGGNYSTFYYAPDRSRYRQTSLNGTTTEDRIYISGLFEKLTTNGSAIEYRHYVAANGTKVAVKVLSTSRNDVLYLHDDHLGSTQTITNAAGTALISEAYDAWGKRRGSNWTGAPSSADLSTINTTTHIGFTGQEQLDNLGLVDLNGRVYDPVIARFMSADPTVQEPYRSQSLNRYSYTWNNPLNQTDPTGFCTTGDRVHADCTEGSTIEVNPDSKPTVPESGQGPMPGTEAAKTAPAATGAEITSNNTTAQGSNTGGGQPVVREQQTANQQMAEVTVTANRPAPEETHHRGLLNIIKTVLDVAGFIPVVGDAANLLSAGISLIQGDYREAAVSAMAAIPVVGIVGEVGKFGKVANEVRGLAEGAETVLRDGMSLPTSKALDAAVEHLGPGYREIAPGVFKSADGSRMVRMTDSDLAKAGNHAGAPHMNFETGNTVTKPNGKETFMSNDNKHIFLPEEK